MTADRRAMANLDDGALGVALVDLGRAVAISPTPDYATAVAARLRAERGSAGRSRRPALNLRWAFIAALIALLLLAAIAAGRGFGLPGLEIFFATPSPSVEPSSPQALSSPASSPAASPRPSPVTSTAGGRLPPTPSRPPTPRLTLTPLNGARTTLPIARDGVTFSVLVPSPDVVGTQEPLVYLDPTVIGGEIALVYTAVPGGDGPIGPDGRPVALVVTESRGSVDEGILGKVLTQQNLVSPVDVNGAMGLWITGPLHALYVLDVNGNFREDTLRSVGDVLVFVRNRTLIRLESTLGLDRTLEIARSLR